ncbi:MAG: hypothetical protein K2O91_12700 [Lachnospiraceae bacterium]|nr:hypothetical protein [Lachnospiraceae bacterium]
MEKKQHPSYGMLQLSRSSIGGNGTALFGSSIMHNDVIRLTISSGFMEREDSQDKYYTKTSRRNCIVEVDMSYTQFAEAITSLNMGDGVPVTITNIGGQPVPKCPYEDKQKMMRKEVGEAADGIARKLNQQAAEVKKLLDEKRVLSKSDREWIVDVLKGAGRRLSNDIPFLNDLFLEQMDKTVTEAKGEFESYVQNKMNSIALEALAGRISNDELHPAVNMIPGAEKVEQVQDGLLDTDEQVEGMQMNM